MPIHLSFLYLLKVTCMAAGLAHISVCMSSCPEASISVMVDVGDCITAAPSRG
jgi:hypothetical protein